MVSEEENELQNQRKVLIKNLRENVGVPVFLLVYRDEEEIDYPEIEFVRRALEEIDEDEGVIILDGVGGEIYPTIEIAAFLRQKFIKHMTTIVPNIAGSSFAYIALLSNCLFGTKTSFLSQFDFTFIQDGHVYRAPKDMQNEDPNVRQDAQFLYPMSINILEKILEQKYSLFKGTLPSNYVSRRNFLINIADICMRKGTHNEKITLSSLEKLGFNVRIYNDTNDVIKMSKDLIKLAKEELKINKKRLCIEIDDYIVFED